MFFKEIHLTKISQSELIFSIIVGPRGFGFYYNISYISYISCLYCHQSAIKT